MAKSLPRKSKAPDCGLDWRGIVVGQIMFPKMVCLNNDPQIPVTVALCENGQITWNL